MTTARREPSLRYTWLKMVRQARAVDGTTLGIAYVLADFGNQHGEDVRPGEEGLAFDCRSTVKTIRRSLATLVRLGLLEVVSEPRRGSASREYRLTIPTDVTPLELCSPDQRRQILDAKREAKATAERRRRAARDADDGASVGVSPDPHETGAVGVSPDPHDVERGGASGSTWGSVRTPRGGASGPHMGVSSHPPPIEVPIDTPSQMTHSRLTSATAVQEAATADEAGKDAPRARSSFEERLARRAAPPSTGAAT